MTVVPCNQFTSRIVPASTSRRNNDTITGRSPNTPTPKTPISKISAIVIISLARPALDWPPLSLQGIDAEGTPPATVPHRVNLFDTDTVAAAGLDTDGALVRPQYA